jgi:PAS domain S-box-containing protein
MDVFLAMPDAATPLSSFPTDLREAYPQTELLWGVLETSLAGLALYTPIRDAEGRVIDFGLDLLNPAAQRMLHQPARPGGTLLARYPHALSSGIFDFHREAFESGQSRQVALNYQADGLDNYFRLSACRVGERLVVSFTDTADATRTEVETALRASQVQEQAARAETELQRQQLHNVLAQAPAMICIFDGPQHTFQFVNPLYQALVGERPLVGKPIAEAMPELASQSVFDLLDQVYHTGEAFRANEMLVQLDHENEGRRELEKRYYNFIYQARRDLAGAVDGILVFAYDVTPQVLARQQVQLLNEELATINEELHASNSEFLIGNAELARTQQLLQQFNQELEDRVLARAAEAETARAETERQRRQFEELFMRAPAAICILNGPDWVYEFVNPGYQQMFYGRQLLGLPLLEALPELAGQPLLDILRTVYTHGETFEGKEVLVPLARTADGPIEDIYFDLTYQARYNEQGHIDGLVTYAYDVTEQVLARRQREVQQAHFRKVFEQAPVAIFVLHGPAYILEVVNPAMRELLGPPMAELLGRPYFEAVPELANQGYPEMLAEVWRTGQPFVAQEQPAKLARHQPSETGYFTFVYQPLYDAQGHTTDIMCVAIDITEQVYARQQVQTLNEELAAINEELQASNEELNETNTQLTRTNVDLDNFIYTASHDLKAPIANIEGLLLALQQELPAAGLVGQVPTMLHLMQAAIERFGRTIWHLTEVSSLQKAHAQPATQVSLARVVEDVQLDLTPLVVQTNARVLVDVAEGTILLFSEKNLRSVVYNLLSNALKYSHPDRAPVVRITSWAQGAYQALEVQDNGLGLDLAQGEAKLFAMFQRLHTHVEGTGIGLYMVKKIVENAGGRIEVRSVPEQGSVFTVYFPN